MRINIVGFAVDDEALKEQFEEWARIGGGQFYDASGANDLGEAIAAALQPPFEVRDRAGAVIGSGVVGGDAVRVSPGTYAVEIRSDPPQTFQDASSAMGKRSSFRFQTTAESLVILQSGGFSNPVRISPGVREPSAVELVDRRRERQ